MLVIVELPGLTLRNEISDQVPYLRDLTNFHNASETLRGSEQRESAMGLYRDDSPAESGRFPVVIGKMVAPDGDVFAVRRTVMALKSSPTFELSVTDPSGTYRCEVAISGRIEFDILDDGWCEFEIPLEAADPRLYGPVQTGSTGVPTPGVGIADPILDPFQEGAPGSLGRIVMSNEAGTAPTEPMVTVAGGLSAGFEVLCIESARIVRVTRPIPEGSYVSIDMGSGEAWIDGQSPLAAAYLPVAEWISIGPGEVCTLQFTPLGVATGTPTMSAIWAEASW